MPSSTMSDEAEFKLPKELPLRAKLKSVTEKVINYQAKGDRPAGSFTKWVWEFSIEEEEFRPLRAWGESEDRLTTHPDNLVRQWGESLSGVQFQIGDGINTDDYYGLPCIVVLEHVVENGKDGKTYYKTPVKDVFPASMWEVLNPNAQPGF